MIIGEKIKNAIKGKGLSMDDAAKELGISRPTLYNSVLSRSEIDKETLQNVITKLKLDLQIDNEDESQNGDKRRGKPKENDKYIALLEKNLKEKDEIINSLKSEVIELQKVRESLDVILRNQSTMDATMQAAIEEISKKVLQSEVGEFLESIYTSASVIELENKRKDNRLRIGNPRSS